MELQSAYGTNDRNLLQHFMTERRSNFNHIGVSGENWLYQPSHRHGDSLKLSNSTPKNLRAQSIIVRRMSVGVFGSSGHALIYTYELYLSNTTAEMELSRLLYETSSQNP